MLSISVLTFAHQPIDHIELVYKAAHEEAKRVITQAKGGRDDNNEMPREALI